VTSRAILLGGNVKYTWGRGYSTSRNGWEILYSPDGGEITHNNAVALLAGIKHEYIAHAIADLLNADDNNES
jgi:hypothetical protein